MSQFITVARVGEIPAGRGRSFQVGRRTIALFHADGKYYAMDDFCPHMGAPLSEGDLDSGTVICCQHRWAFRLADGASPDSATLRAETFPVRVLGDDIQVELPDG
jgi:nitrite reductase (NADH) small subunit